MRCQRTISLSWTTSTRIFSSGLADRFPDTQEVVDGEKAAVRVDGLGRLIFRHEIDVGERAYFREFFDSDNPREFYLLVRLPVQRACLDLLFHSPLLMSDTRYRIVRKFVNNPLDLLAQVGGREPLSPDRKS